jgi:transposase
VASSATCGQRGRNARLVIHGALYACSSELVWSGREHNRQDDCIACLEALGQVRPDTTKLLNRDNAPPHKPQFVAEAAENTHITLTWLPFRAPEVNPCEDVWRVLK